MNPLETRSMPHGLWQFMPAGIVNADVAAQRWCVSHVNREAPFFQAVGWLTITPEGAVFGLGVLALVSWWLYLRSTRRSVRSARRRSRDFAFCLAGLLILYGLANAVSMAVKFLVGRLKPHVNFYNSVVTPALSFPSAHAFNTAFVWALVWVALDRGSRERFRVMFRVAAVFVFLIGVSRVLLNQHYPIDILGGWILGGALGLWWARYYRRLLERIKV